MKQISIFIIGVAAAFASVPAFAEDFTAGKTPAQLFRSDCGECHHTPNGLAKDADVQSLAGFLREHYTTKSETAGALAAYVSGFASSGRSRGSRSDAEKKQSHDDGDVPRPPRRVGSASPKTNASETEDPISRLRTYLSPGAKSSEAGKTGAPKARKRRKPADDAPAAGSGAIGSDAPAAAAAPAAAVAQPAEAPAQQEQQ